jgi:hypothetical protein
VLFRQGKNAENVADLQIDWSCLGKDSGSNKIIAFLGLNAFFGYGIGLPIIRHIVLRRYRYPIWTETVDFNIVIEVTRVFLLTYRDDRW